jgi:long-chain acyl-CoA synthetase
MAGPARYRLDPSDLIQAINENLLLYKKIREIHVIDELSISTAGKILKGSLDRLLR